MTLPKSVKLVEVAARDGLQNEAHFIPTPTKIALINQLSAAGFVNIEAASFVSPKWIPQMADGAAVMAGIQRHANTCYSVLTPNMKGFEAAVAAQANEVVIFGAASEGFSQKNINCSIAESIERFTPVAKAALDAGLRLRASISCSYGCPYDGPTPIEKVLDVVQRFQDLGVQEYDIADTIGVGTPIHTTELFQAVAQRIPIHQVAGHFHDTYGQALANILAALQTGVSIFHSSVAGLGGCPYAKGATGNVASEDVVYMLHGMGIHTGINLDALVKTGVWISEQIGKPSQSRAGRALWLKQQ